MFSLTLFSFFFFFNDTATTEIYTLSYTTLFRSPFQEFECDSCFVVQVRPSKIHCTGHLVSQCPQLGHNSFHSDLDRKSTRLNSSHLGISYAVFCLKKKKNLPPDTPRAHHTHRVR